jgi:stalled ribosome rescue protein Dom34
LITETASEEADETIDVLDEYLNNAWDESVILFSLKEIEDRVFNQGRNSDARTEYLLLTDKYLAVNKDKNRIHRLLQISKNTKVKTRIINENTPAGKRITRYGGIFFMAIPAR